MAPAIAAAWRLQSPVQSATASQRTVPQLVSTPRMRPPSVRMPVTEVSSKIFAPRARAPLTSAAQRSEGLTRPSPGDQTAPMMSSVRISGQRSAASSGPTHSAATPNTCASASWRRTWVTRSGLVAIESEPLLIQPVCCPVSASSCG